MYLICRRLLKNYVSRIGGFFFYKPIFCSFWFFSRDRANLQLSNRRLERKVKELMLQVDDEHLSLTDQKEQVEDKTTMQIPNINPTIIPLLILQ